MWQSIRGPPRYRFITDLQGAGTDPDRRSLLSCYLFDELLLIKFTVSTPSWHCTYCTCTYECFNFNTSGFFFEVDIGSDGLDDLRMTFFTTLQIILSIVFFMKRTSLLLLFGYSRSLISSRRRERRQTASQNTTQLQLQHPAHRCQSSLQVLNVCQKQKGEEIILEHSIVQCDK